MHCKIHQAQDPTSPRAFRLPCQRTQDITVPCRRSASQQQRSQQPQHFIHSAPYPPKQRLLAVRASAAAAEQDSSPESMDGPQALEGSPRRFKKVAVFCGASSGGRDGAYVAAAKALGQELVRRGIGLVYGGGNVGLMGAVAHAVAEGLGEGSVIGVIPTALAPREISGHTVGEIRLVDDMHSRKAMMFEEADAFITIPGGFGTLDETLEITTWQQLGFHTKPVGLLNVEGFFDSLLQFLDHATAEGFIRPASRDILVSASSPADLIDALERYEPPPSLIKLAAEGKLSVHERG